LVRLTRWKPVQITLALSIPLLALLLATEIHIHRAIRELSASDFGTKYRQHVDIDARAVDLGELRREYEKKRRKEALRARIPDGAKGKRSLEGPVWGPADEEQLQVEVEDHWPEWWGNVDVVGPSPYDFAPAGGGKKRVLFLTGGSSF
jgi:hypothetical protein